MRLREGLDGFVHQFSEISRTNPHGLMLGAYGSRHRLSHARLIEDGSGFKAKRIGAQTSARRTSGQGDHKATVKTAGKESTYLHVGSEMPSNSVANAGLDLIGSRRTD